LCNVYLNIYRAGGAKIYSIFNNFGMKLLQIDPLEGLDDNYIKELIDNISVWSYL